MSIVEPIGEDDRRREQRINLARKALWLRERNARKDANGRVSDADNRAAMVAAGITPPPAPADNQAAARVARLEAGIEHGLSREEVDQLTGTTPDELAAEVDALRPPGDGGARGPGVRPTLMGSAGILQRISEAERAGDADAARLAKAELLVALKEERQGI